MSNNEHPITPPPELVQQIAAEPSTWLEKIKKAYQAGADQELEACIEWMYDMQLALSGDIEVLRSARRPKPPSLKEQAIEAQLRMWNGGVTHDDWELVRRALEALPE